MPILISLGDSMDALVRSAALVKYSEIAHTLGVDPGRMISQAGGHRACLHSPDLRVPEPWLSEVFEETARDANCPDLGLRVAERWKLSDFGPISLLMQHQPDLRHALTELEGYRHLLSNSVKTQIEERGELALVRVWLTTGRPEPGRQSIELAVGVTLTLMRAILGATWRPHCVHFSLHAPTSHAIHTRFIGPRIEFDCGFDGIVLHRGDLERANPRADVNLARYAKHFLDVQHSAAGNSVAAETRRAISTLLPNGRSSVQLVGQQLGLGARTLQRRLEQEGADFSSLLNEVRTEMVTRYLADHRYSMTQIAMLVGFSNVTALARWFGTHFGVSPTHWRNTARDKSLS